LASSRACCDARSDSLRAGSPRSRPLTDGVLPPRAGRRGNAIEAERRAQQVFRGFACFTPSTHDCPAHAPETPRQDPSQQLFALLFRRREHLAQCVRCKAAAGAGSRHCRRERYGTNAVGAQWERAAIARSGGGVAERAPAARGGVRRSGRCSVRGCEWPHLSHVDHRTGWGGACAKPRGVHRRQTLVLRSQRIRPRRYGRLSDARHSDEPSCSDRGLHARSSGANAEPRRSGIFRPFPGVWALLRILFETLRRVGGCFTLEPRNASC